jgi:hypothetical protein
MSTGTETRDETVRLTRNAWETQRLLGDLNTWRTWAIKSLESYKNDLNALAVRGRMDHLDISNSVRVAMSIEEALKVLKAMDSPMHTATAKRIRQAKER